MKKYHVERYTTDCDVLLLPHKDGSGYSFINLTSGHICPCKFSTMQDALNDMINRPEVKSFYEVTYKDV